MRSKPRAKMKPYLRRAVARRYGLEPDGTVHELECAYCGAPGTMTWQPAGTLVRLRGALELSPSPVDFVETTLVYDHVVPCDLGGPHKPHNILMACWSCNGSKGNKPLDEWQKWLLTPRGLRSPFWHRFFLHASSPRDEPVGALVHSWG